jgi:hypothetical protein
VTNELERKTVLNDDDKRAAVIEYFSSGDYAGKYDLASADSRGVPNKLVDGSSLREKQLKRLDVLYHAFIKKLIRATVAPLPVERSEEEKRDRSKLPRAYWDNYPGSLASKQTRGSCPRLGIDVGGVIAIYDRNVHGADEEEDTQLRADTIITDGCFESMEILIRHFGTENTFIVSKAGPTMSARTTRWLHEIDIFNKTGLLVENVYYVKERIQKADVVEALGITHFIDDRWSVLCHLNVCERRYLFPGDDRGVPKNLISKSIQLVEGWRDVVCDVCNARDEWNELTL